MELIQLSSVCPMLFDLELSPNTLCAICIIILGIILYLKSKRDKNKTG